MNKTKRLRAFLLLVVSSIFMMTTPAVFAQTVSISGVILDDYDKPLGGVLVYNAQNTKEGTLSSDDGRYSLSVNKDCKQLTFDCMGYQTVTLALKDVAVVRMREDVQMLEETVVTGIYTRKKESFTGSIEALSGEELRRVGNKNVLESLKTLDQSLLVMENLEQGSNPNAMTSMQMRGASSFDMETTGLKSNFVSKANMPLFILDGFETSIEKIKDMDMNRVQSITILKDASAKAIYGSKGGNGVIVIETKSLDSGRGATVNYNGSMSFEMPDLTSYNLCNALEKLEVERRENYYTAGYTSTPDVISNLEIYNARLKRALEGESTYWLSKPLRTGVSNKHSVQVELGNRELKSFNTVSFNNVEGAMKGSGRRTVSADMNLAYRRKGWTVRNIMSIANMNSSESNYGDFSTYAELNPYYNPYDAEGNLVRFFNVLNTGSSRIGNPLYDASLDSRNASSYLDFTDNLYVEYQPWKMLRIVVRGGIDTKKTASELFLPALHSSFNLGENISEEEMLSRGSYEMSNGEYLSYSADASAQFNKNIAKKHDVFVTAQYNISSTTYSEVSHYAEGFPSSRMNDIVFARQYAIDRTPSGYSGLNRSLGALLTAGYSYDSRYMIDLTLKGSASSAFGTNNRWGTFWSAGAGWNIHNEKWLKDLSWLKQLKLRYSMGSSGNQNFMSNSSIAVYHYNSKNYYNGFAGATLGNMENPSLGWEEKMEYNAGIDFRAGRANATIDAYIADTRNLVFSQSILPSTGFASVSDNLGKVRNKGIELSLGYTIYQSKNSFVAISAKGALNDNRILEISDSMKEYNNRQIQNAAETGSAMPVTQYYDGAPMHSIWAVPSLGVDPITGDEFYITKEGNISNVWSAANLKNCGSSDPLFNGNMALTSEIRGVGFSLVVTGYGGGYRYNSTLVNKLENADISVNVDRRIFSDRWYYPGQNAQYRNGYSSNGYGTQKETKPTSRFVQANNVLNLSSVTLYYEFPTRVLRPLHLYRLRASVYGSDLYTFSSIHIERGTSYPYARSVSFSLTATL